MFSNLNAVADKYIQEKTVQNLYVRVIKNSKVIADVIRSNEKAIDENTLFDMASVTKILATTTLALIALDKNLIALDDKVDKFFSCPDDKKNLTIKHLLTHTMGIGYKNLTKNGNTYDNIADYILSIPTDISIGSDVLYSCPAFILLGKIIEKVFTNTLDFLFTQYVTKPLGMSSTVFCPTERKNVINANLDSKKQVLLTIIIADPSAVWQEMQVCFQMFQT